ncbi:MAG: class I SAM-dependent methyltransferase [Ignavibacteriae bacterium]|nr:class I SAM-dependent methyltransferase [Ignavibacteriota bacterium]
MPQVIKNKFDYFELKKKPSVEELKKYYSEKYYQENNATYGQEYTPDEIKFFSNKIVQKYSLVKERFSGKANPDMLDIGCGEGFTLKYFSDMNWNVTGLDYSSFGCKRHNPEVLEKITTGDIFANLEEIVKSGRKFDLIWLDNVLEHVLEPHLLLTMCREIGRDNSAVIIEVPNDFSKIQSLALQKGYIDNEFWIVSPDHISYFNAEGLENLCQSAGWKKIKIISDYPIEVNLLNDDCNYIKDSKKGKNTHFQRIEFENLLHEISVEKTNKLFEALAELGMGRSLTGVFIK